MTSKDRSIPRVEYFTIVCQPARPTYRSAPHHAARGTRSDAPIDLSPAHELRRPGCRLDHRLPAYFGEYSDPLTSTEANPDVTGIDFDTGTAVLPRGGRNL